MIRVAALIESCDRPDRVEQLLARLARTEAVEIDAYVVERGSRFDRLSPHAALWAPDPEGRGACLAQRLAFERARACGDHDYYWFLSSADRFDGPADVAAALIDALEREPRLALLSAREDEGAPEPTESAGWRPTATVAPSGYLLRAAAAEQLGPPDARFESGWGAVDELAFRAHAAGWLVGRSASVSMRREAEGSEVDAEREHAARRCAYDTLRARHGEDWDERFVAAAPAQTESDELGVRRELWLASFGPLDRAQRVADRMTGLSTGRRPYAQRLLPDAGRDGLRVAIGGGPERAPGWIHVDPDPAASPDVVGELDDLPMFDPGTVAAIEIRGLLPRLTPAEASEALREWRRMLASEGELFLELPDLERCAERIRTPSCEAERDAALRGIYGDPGNAGDESQNASHRWGWTRASLARLLEEHGFDQIEFGPAIHASPGGEPRGLDLRVSARAPERTEFSEPVPVDVVEPSTARSDAPARLLLAWPRWDEPSELEHLFAEFGRTLAERPDLTLAVYLHAGECDHGAAVEALEAAHGSHMDATLPIDLELIQGPLEEQLLAGIAELTVGVVELPFLAARGPNALGAIGAPRVRTSAALEQVLDGASVEGVGAALPKSANDSAPAAR